MNSKEVLSTDEPLIERIAEEILERRRAGEWPTVEAYCQQYPEHAEELRSFLPALIAVERLKPNSRDVSGTFGGNIDIDGKRREFIGDYRILRELGRGGMGVVYEAEQQSLGRHVALKVLLHSVAMDARAAQRFEREARAAARMHHTNIVPVFDVGSDNEHLFYAMQLIQGQAIDMVIDDLKQLRTLHGSSLASKAHPKSIARSLVDGQFDQDPWLEQTQDALTVAPDSTPGRIDATEALAAQSTSTQSAALPGQRDMSSAENNRPAYFLSVAKIGLQTAQALAYAHARGIIHRDIKPSNLLLDGNGTVWITDFGLAKTSDHSMTHTGDILGTIRYMSPERFKGQCDVRADIYSLGLTLYELLTLRPAFVAADQLKLIDRIVKSEPQSPRSLDASIPLDLETIVLKCIDKDARRRYQSADELCEDLERFIQDRPVKARRISSTERLARWSRRNKSTAASLAVVALLLLILNIAGPLMTLRIASLRDQAVTSRDYAEHAREAADEARLVAIQRAKTISQNLYLAKMMLASAAARTPGGMGRVIALTDEWLPQPDQPDFRGWEWYYLRSIPHKGLSTRNGQARTVGDVVWSPDGTRLASASGEKIEIWSPLSGKTLYTLPGETNGKISWNPDGTHLVSHGPSNRLWNVETEAVERTWLGSEESWGGCVAWDPDGSTIASSELSRVKILDAITGESKHIFEVPFNVLHLAWSPAGKRLAIGGVSGGVGQFQGHVAFWNAASAQIEGSVPVNGRWSYVAWNPDGTRISATNGWTEVTIWDVATRKELQKLTTPDTALSIDWSPNGKFLAAGLNNRLINVWQWDANTELFAPLLQLESFAGRRITSLAWSPDSKYISSTCGSETVNVWDVEQHLSEIMERDAVSPIDEAHGIFWKPNGQLLAVNAGTDTVRILNMSTNELREIDYESSGNFNAVLISPDGERLAAKTAEGISIWDLKTGKHQSWRLDRPYIMAWCPESKLLAAVAFQDNGRVRLFDTESRSERPHFQGHKSHTHALAWSPDGSKLASGGGPGEGEIRIWNVRDGNCLKEIPGGQAGIKTLAWNVDDCLASGDEDSNVNLWDPNTGQKIKILTGHLSQVQSVAWSPDSQRLASTGRENRLIIWDPESGLEAFSMNLPVNPRNGAVSWSPDGRSLAVLSEGRVRILDAGPGYAEEAGLTLSSLSR